MRKSVTIEEEILRDYRVIAVVGLSSEPERPSNRVASYLKGNGYKIIPVNPNEKIVLEETCYPDLASVPVRVEVVDIFRKPEEVLPVVQEAVRIGAKAVWMQEKVINEQAADYARKAGLKVVMNKCMRKELYRMFLREEEYK
jgi:predicted CoA-binding protein